jgi:hypothetical protein
VPSATMTTMAWPAHEVFEGEDDGGTLGRRGLKSKTSLRGHDVRRTPARAYSVRLTLPHSLSR